MFAEDLCLVLFSSAVLVPFWFCNHLALEERTSCLGCLPVALTLSVLWLFLTVSVGWSAVCDCGIYWPH